MPLTTGFVGQKICLMKYIAYKNLKASCCLIFFPSFPFYYSMFSFSSQLDVQYLKIKKISWEN